MLRLLTLGRLELQRAESPSEPVALQPKRLALLAYLALAGPGAYHRRDALLALFWPERRHADARHALRQAVYQLRNTLGDGLLASRGAEELGLSPHVHCDAREFTDALRTGRTGEAMALYHGDFFAGVFVPDVAPEWDEWVGRTRARLRAGAAAAAWAIAELAIQSGDLAAGLAAAYRARELDPDDEAGLQRLIQWLDRSGRRTTALAEFKAFARRMREEYHAEPSAGTTALIAALQRSAPPYPRRVSGAMPVPAPHAREHSRRPGPEVWRLRVAARRRQTPGKLPTVVPIVQIDAFDPKSDIESPR